jgi:Flp pilus assembly protein TadD
LFTEKNYAEALPPMERTARLAPENAEVLYDLAVIRLAVGDKDGALEALEKSLKLNSKLKAQATVDDDLASLRNDKEFNKLLKTAGD